MRPPASTAFNAEAFAWSAFSGQAVINGRLDYRRDGQVYDCTGSVALTPDTPHTRNRFNILYGSIDRAAVPKAMVRARTCRIPTPTIAPSYGRRPGDDGRFSFTGLPDGGWFVITPVSAGGERVVLMRRVETRGGRTMNITL